MASEVNYQSKVGAHVPYKADVSTGRALISSEGGEEQASGAAEA